MRAFYPDGYHLLLRDHERITPIDDVLFWIRRPRDAAAIRGRSGCGCMAREAEVRAAALIRRGFRAMWLRSRTRSSAG